MEIKVHRAGDKSNPHSSKWIVRELSPGVSHLEWKRHWRVFHEAPGECHVHLEDKVIQTRGSSPGHRRYILNISFSQPLPTPSHCRFLHRESAPAPKEMEGQARHLPAAAFEHYLRPRPSSPSPQFFQVVTLPAKALCSKVPSSLSQDRVGLAKGHPMGHRSAGRWAWTG